MATFDPDAYLAGKNGSTSFDPDAYLAGKATPKPFDPDAYIAGATQQLAAKLTATPDFDPVSHATQFEQGHPEWEAAFQADQSRKNRSLGEKASAALKTATTLTPWIEGVKGVGKFLGGLGLTAFDTQRQIADTAIGVGADASGAHQTATKFQNKAQQLRAENILAAQTNEERLKNVARIAKQHPIATTIATAGLSPIIQPFVPPDDERTDFANRVEAAKKNQQLAAGKPLDTGAIAAITPNNGEPLSTTYSPEGLAATGASPVLPLAVEMKTAASDPMNLLLAEAPGLPGARTVAGGGVELAGKAIAAPGRALDAIGGRLGKIGAAINNPTALAGEAGIALALHPPSATVVGTALGAKLAQRIGEVLESQGKEFRTGIPGKLTEAAAAAQDAGKSAIGTNLARAAGDTVVRGAATAYGFAPVNAALSEGDPEEFAKSEVGAGIFGAGLGALHASPSLRAMDAALQGKLMEAHGRQQFTDNPAFAAHQNTVSRFTPDDQSRIARIRSFLFGGTGTDVMVVDGNTFANADGGNIGQDARGKISADGKTIYLNADAIRPGESAGAKTADTAGHETGHAVVNWLVDASRQADANGMMKAISDKLSDQEKNEMAKGYWDALEKSTKGITPANRDAIRAKIEGDNPMPKIIEENLAEITRAILGGEDVSKFTLSKPIESKVMDTAARVLESLGLSAPIDPNASLAFKTRMVKEAARRMGDMLYEVGGKSRTNRDPTTAEIIRDLQKQMDAIPKYDASMSFAKAQEYAEQMQSLQKRLDAATAIRDGEAPAPTQGTTAPSGNAAALAQSRKDARDGLTGLGYKAGQVNQWINDAYQQHGSPIADSADLVKAVLRISRGGTVQPGEFIPKPAAPTAPKTPIIAPTGEKANFTDELGQKHTITGLSPDAPRIGDIVVTRDGEMRRVTRALGDTVDTARPIDPLNARGTKTHKLDDISTVTHDYTPTATATSESKPAAPSEPISPEPASGTTETTPETESPSLTTRQRSSGEWEVIDKEGKTVSIHPTQAGAEQSIRQQGRGRFSLPPPVRDTSGNESHDIVSALFDTVNGIHFGQMGKEERQQSLPAHIRGLIGSSDPRNSPDAVAQTLFDGDPESGIPSYGDGTAETMFALINEAITARRNFARQSKTEQSRQRTEAQNTPPNESQTSAPDEPIPSVGGTAVASPPIHTDTPEPAQISEADVDRIAAEAETDVRSKRTARHKPATLPKAITDAQVDAIAAAHEATIPANYEGIRLRTDPIGKQTISGKVNPNRPFDAFLLKLADLSEHATNTLLNLQNKIGQTVTLDYQHAPENEDKVTAEERREAQQASPAHERAAGEAETQTETKNFIPLEVRFNKGKDAPSFTVLGASPEKLLNNFNLASEAVTELGGEVPYRDIHDPHLVMDMNHLAQNHANGRKFDGRKIEGFPDTQIPNLDEGFTPHVIPQDRFDFLNLILGDQSAKTGKKGVSPEQKLKQGLAVANKISMTEAGETNLLRESINRAKGAILNKDGKPTTWSKATIENPLSEALRVDLIEKVHPETSNDDASIRPHGYKGEIDRFFGEGSPNRNFTAAGFMPAEEAGAEGKSRERAAKLWKEKGTESPFFKKWFGESKVVDEQWKPIRVFHGTNDTFTEFEHDRPNRKDTGWLGQGFYFTDDPKLASDYTSIKAGADAQVIPAFLKIENPYRASVAEKEKIMLAEARGDKEAARRRTQELIEQGYDGIILPYKQYAKSTEYVAFHPEQIKSATGNQGTFDPNNPDMRFMPDTGTPEEGGTPGERLAREAEQAGVVLNLSTLKGLIAEDKEAMDRVRARIQQNTGKPARFMPDEKTAPQDNANIRKRDRDYVEAVNRNDVETAKRLTQEAAKQAGYTVKVFHGTPHGDITEFDPTNSPSHYEGRWEDDTRGNYHPSVAGWFSTDERVADSYAAGLFEHGAGEWDQEKYKHFTDADLPEGTRMRVISKGHSEFLTDQQIKDDEIPSANRTPGGKLKKNSQLQVILPSGQSIWNINMDFSTPNTAMQSARKTYNFPIPQRTSSRTMQVFLKMKNPKTIDLNGGLFYKMGDKAAKALYEGHDGLIVKNVHDPGSNPSRIPIADSIAVFDPSQIKSADPVTRDIDGNVIPLSERFNPGTKDIRFMPTSPTAAPQRSTKGESLPSSPSRGGGAIPSAQNDRKRANSQTDARESARRRMMERAGTN